MLVPIGVLKRGLSAAFLGYGVRERTQPDAQVRLCNGRSICEPDFDRVRRGLRWGGRGIRLDGGSPLRTRCQIPRNHEEQKPKRNEDVP